MKKFSKGLSKYSILIILASLGLGLYLLGHFYGEINTTPVSSAEVNDHAQDGMHQISDSNSEAQQEGMHQIQTNKSVIIIGAGASGLAAGYALAREGVDFAIIEATDHFGGRMAKAEDFADFPIDIGAEWIHTDKDILDVLIDDEDRPFEEDLIRYAPEDMYWWEDGELSEISFAEKKLYGLLAPEYKFKDTTWYDYFAKYIVPSVENHIVYESPVNQIDYTGEKIKISTTDDKVFSADRVIVTVPLSVLKKEYITFIPPLPEDKARAIGAVHFPPALKIFLSFREKFYPSIIAVTTADEDRGEKTYYDAAYGKESEQNILGLLAVGVSAEQYHNLGSDEEIKEAILMELDEMFDGKAHENVQDITVKDWTNTPHIGGSYSHHSDDEKAVVDALAKPIAGKVFFAGEAMNADGLTSTVHGAALSGYSAVRNMKEDLSEE